VNPPIEEARRASAPPPAAEERRPAAVAVDHDDAREQPVANRPQTDSEGRPVPVHVSYARTGAGTDPEVVAATPARAAPRPVRSPFWAAVRSHLWLVAIVIVLAGGAATGYWGLRVHQRISEAAIEHDVGVREHPAAVRCIEQQSNGAVWACGLVYRAASKCLIANVNPVGDWNTNDGLTLCDNRPQLTAILPNRITASAVAADMQGQLVMANARCARAPTPSVRWACLGPSSTGGAGDCLLVRVAPWRGLGFEASDICPHVPALQKHHETA
jgi:hypothetical protein